MALNPQTSHANIGRTLQQFIAIGSSAGGPGPGPGAGTVTQVSAGDLPPLFTTNVNNPTTTPAISFALNTQPAGLFFATPPTGPNVAPTFRALNANDFPIVPTTKGGTGQSTYAEGDLLVGNGAASLSKLPMPALPGYLLASAPGGPIWLQMTSVDWTFGSINNTPIGNVTPSTGTFTFLKTGYGSFAQPGLIMGDASYGLYIESGSFFLKNSNNGVFAVKSIDGTAEYLTITPTGINNTPIGATTPSTGNFTNLFATSASFTSINNTPIGNAAPSTGAFTQVQILGAVNTSRHIQFYTGASERWRVATDGGAESGGNVGSDFNIYRYNDAGAFVATAMRIDRSTGSVTFDGGINATAIGATTPSTGVFTSAALSVGGLSASWGLDPSGGGFTYFDFARVLTFRDTTSGHAVNGAFYGGGLQGTPIGSAVPSTGNFTDVASTGNIYSTNLGATRVGILNAGGASGSDTYFGMHYDPTNNVGVIQSLSAGVSWRGISLAPNGGNVGIGTTTPGAKLDVRIATAGAGSIIAAFGSSAAARIGLYDEDATYAARIQSAGGLPFFISPLSGSGAPLALGANGTEYVRIINGGNVGIGTTAPEARLDLGAGAVGARFYTYLGGNANAGFGIDMSGNGYEHTMFAGANVDPSLGRLSFGQRDRGTGVYTQKMVLALGTGNLGIGTEPTAQLHTTGSVRFQAFGAGTLVTDASGNVSASATGPIGSGVAKLFARWGTSGGIVHGNGVTSVVKLSTGRYEITFAAALPDNIYLPFLQPYFPDIAAEVEGQTATVCTVGTRNRTTGAYTDCGAGLIVYRN